MNDLLKINEIFSSVPGTPPGPPTLPPGSISVSDIDRVRSCIAHLIEFWKNTRLTEKILVSVEYREVIAKSNRLKVLFKSSDTKIRGAKFINSPKRHVITYLLKREELTQALSELEVFRSQFVQMGGYAEIKTFYNDFLNCDIVKKKQIKKNISPLSPQKVVKWIRDVYYINDIHLPQSHINDDDYQILNLFNVGEDLSVLFKKIGIQKAKHLRDIGPNVFEFEKNDLLLLKAKAPYLISMGESGHLDALKTPESIRAQNVSLRNLPKPLQEPTIGVIDTLFDQRVTFHKWVKYENLVPTEHLSSFDKRVYGHGTSISSLIVCGQLLNPDLDDGCGFFKVRHFGVMNGGKIHYLTLLEQIKRIIQENSDIQVWNLALGSSYPIQTDSISFLAAELDKLQRLYDIIFVVAGTNSDRSMGVTNHLIGMPADSINSLVVGSVNKNGKAASYARSGPVLSYFTKPDLSCQGGEENERIKVISGWNENLGENDIGGVYGTSFSTPWISRKLGYLIHIMRLRKDEAKALLLDSTQTWGEAIKRDYKRGYGVVPKHISEIVNVPDDEIRFILSGVSVSYETKTIKIPVPFTSKGFPFVARATLTYTPDCDLNQGVDYTNTEIDIHFGRCTVSPKGSVLIKSIDNNIQAEEGHFSLQEKRVREQFGKWDNVKIVKERFTSRTREKKKYGDFWGVSLKRKERFLTATSTPQPFSIVITLKEIHGKNRFQQFIDLCDYHQKSVIHYNIESQIRIKNQEETDISWE